MASKPAKTDPIAARKTSAPRSKRTPLARERILRALRVGAALTEAALCGGLTYQTLNEWRKADKDFDLAIDVARAEMEVAMLARIEAAAAESKHWQAAAWKLERIFKHRYALQRFEDPSESAGQVTRTLRFVVAPDPGK